LVATYCENVAPSGAIVSYGFNEETGEIAGPLDKTESWFSEYGDTKGICFSAEGTKILVTFESDKPLSIVRKVSSQFALHKDLLNKNLPALDRLMKFSCRAITSLRTSGVHSKKWFKLENHNLENRKPTKNGIAIFSINAEGKINRSPEQVIVRKNFCRLENIDIFDGTCVITDVANHALFLYDMTQDPKFEKPVQTINVGNASPHGAKFSPDGRLLVISSLGLKVVKQEPRFCDWVSPREDKLLVCERAN
jgi:hypothetical protein